MGALDATPHSADPDGDPVTVAGGQLLLRGEAVDFQRGDLLDGRYQIEKVIGRGATGCVLQAFDRVVRAVVAVKILKPDLAADERWVERLGGELRYARKLQHPNVCRVYDVGAADGHHFLTMEFASGGSLRQRMVETAAASAARTWEQRIVDARAVIDGLAAIHAVNIVHRDVKPENVLVMEDGRLVVSDFGVAITLGHNTFFSSKVAGTPNYMAPEILMDDRPATTASDVWSLGVVLHEILFGRRPEWETTPSGRILKPSVDRKAPAPKRALARLCTECLEEYAPKRPADAAAVKRRFEMAVEGRLRPLRTRLRKTSALIAVTFAAAVLVATAIFNRSPSSDSSPRAAIVRGEPTDLRYVSRAVLRADKAIRCFDLLPGRKSVRLVWGSPVEAVDVELTSGKVTPSRVVPESFASGCPRLSRDGRRLLYVRAEKGKPSQILLAENPYGRDAVPLTEGESPVWMPSGEEFVYGFDKRRVAAFSLPKTRLLFPDSSPVEKLIDDIAVNDAGDRVAFSFRDGRRENIIEVYNYPSLRLERAVRFKQFVYGIGFDGRRGTLQMSVTDPRELTLLELTRNGDVQRVAALPGANIVHAFRIGPEMAFITTKASRSVVLRAPSGEERAVAYGGLSRPAISDAGDALLETRMADGRLVIALKRWNDLESTPITSGPNDTYPSFGPGATSFVFVRLTDNTIMSCGLDASGPSGCKPIHVEPLGPRSAAMSPDGKLVAYHTLHGSDTRVRVVAGQGGGARDLGIYRGGCALLWSSTTHLWMFSRETNHWWELDTIGGAPTGRTYAVTKGRGSPCDHPPPSPGQSTLFGVKQVAQQTLGVRLASGL